MRQIDKKKLLALDNMAIIYRAAAAGMKVFPEDQFVNYAEIDHELETREDQMVQKTEKDLRKQLESWLGSIAAKTDISMDDLDLQQLFKDRILEHIRFVWNYGESSAGQELEKMQVAANSELLVFAAGAPTTRDDTWNDAYEWYDRYSQELSKKAETDLFQHMQPVILEHIESGTLRTGLVDSLLDQFTRVGVVRADIIARTESSKAFNWGRRYRFDQSPALGGYRYSAIMDERTTPICRGLHGHSWEAGDQTLDGYTPPNHFRCRSVLVPISKYVDFSFDPPPDDFLESLDLSDKELEKAKNMLDKFKDSSFYPKSVMAAMPKPAGSPAAAAPPQEDPEPEADPDPEPDLQEIVDQSREYSAAYIQDLIDTNVRRGVSSDHPTIERWRELVDEINSDKYAGKMILAEFNSRAKDSMKITEFEQHGQIFIGEKGKISKANRDKMMAEIEKVKDDPLFKGVKFQLENNSKSRLAYYNAYKDVLGLTPDAIGSRNKGGLRTIYHEVGHRVHNQSGLYDSKFEGILRDNGINITPDQWNKWKKATDPYWEAKRTSPGSDLLPDDVFSRYEYPINAKFYYKKGTKANYYKEMFAETSSVYLDGDQEWIDKVNRTYPGLLDFMEEVYDRGNNK